MNYRKVVFLSFIATLGLTPAQAQTHRGRASYYSKRATGARTASGERLHHDSLTCAHRNYPFGTLLKVKNLSNGKEIIVKVTDRGPYGRGRIIDLSYGAARELGMLSQGVAMVEVRRVDGPNPPYRMDDEPERGLPDFEFDFSKAAYSFINDWKDDEDVDKGLTKEEMMMKQKMPTQKQAQEKRQKILAKNDPTTATPNKEENGKTKEVMTANKPVAARPSSKTPHPTAKTGTTVKAKQHAATTKEKDPSFWSSVFDHVKGWFGN